MAEFTDYQRKMWRWLSYVTVCTHQIDRDKNGNFIINKTGRIRRFLYYLIWVNSLVKVTYLILTYQGFLLEVHFLDQMSMWDWFLCFFELLQESNMWYRKYPLYEVFAANWRIQEDIFLKLGSPSNVKQKILRNDKLLVYIHTTIVIIGCCALMIQFFTAPKYALNTYAMIPWDTWPLKVMFAAHEYFFMWHIWVHAASSVVIGQVFAFTYTILLAEMTSVMQKLPQLGQIKQTSEEELKNLSKPRKSHSGGSPEFYMETLNEQFIPDRIIDIHAVVPGTKYDILSLIHDYRNVMLAAKEFNVWAGKWVGGITGTLYLQFVSDVFMMIQLLKEPETDIMGVFFFFEDAFVGMFMMFRMLIIMSRVYPISEEFLQEFKNYLQHENPIRKYLLKYEKTLRPVAAKLGGHSTNPGTVPKGIHVLFNYYIAAAMWQRPLDRLT